MHVVTRFVVRLWIFSTIKPVHRIVFSTCLSGRSAYEVSYPFCRLSQECSWRCWIYGNLSYICLFVCQLHIFLCTISVQFHWYIYTYTHMFVQNGLKVLPPIMLDSHKICCWLTQTNCPCTSAFKQWIDVLIGIAWDNKTARLFGEWIFSGYILDIWFLPEYGSDYWDWFTGSACKWRDFGLM
jgi:hypothetical protein